MSVPAGVAARLGIGVTVLGSSSSIPRPGRACSSYLIEAAETTLLIDLGTGAFANLTRYLMPDTLDAILISHMHADHFLDLIPLRYAMKYGIRTNARKLPIYLPPGGEAMLRRLCSAFAKETGDDFLSDSFDVDTYDPAAQLELGEVQLSFAPTEHFIPTFAMRCETAGMTFAYSSDTSPTQSVVELARGADLFLSEATLSDAEAAGRGHGHMSARQAATMATQADVKRLALTHYSSHAQPERMAAEARSAFAGPLEVVDDGLRLLVS